ncbi:MAG: HD-GYP domain-containing protein, partial [Gemmatimonadales bacterium]
MSGVRLSEVISALSLALDITEGQPMGHAVRTCLIGMRIGSAIGLTDEQKSDLFYALLLKDAGCSSNASRLCSLFSADDHGLKRDYKFTDWTRTAPAVGYVYRHIVPGASPLTRAFRAVSLGVGERDSAREMTATRCHRGAEIATMLGFSPATATAIRHLDEHWDGRGLPGGVKGHAIPLIGRILCISQTVEVYFNTFDIDGAWAVAAERAGSWFDPELVEVLGALRRDAGFWNSLRETDLRERVASLEPQDKVLLADESRLDTVAEAFARVIDAKSPYTCRHSEGVADIAVNLGRSMGFDMAQLRDLRRAALLHDIGKLGVSNLILDKPAKLTDEEFAQVRNHPRYTMEILNRVSAFRGIADVAGSHHERLDGRGYHRGLGAADLSLPARVLATADVCEALLAERPYRKG